MGDILSLGGGRRALVMGIVNVTPDSFSDGGLYADAASAIAHGEKLAAEGADLLDIGGRVHATRLRSRVAGGTDRPHCAGHSRLGRPRRAADQRGHHQRRGRPDGA